MREVAIVFLLLVCLSTYVECRYCTYLTAGGFAYTITCQSYEFCCGNSCCRSATFKFYQFWYFWLSVILILLLCSGGSWWYRLRYRNQFFNPRYSTSTIFGGPEHRHPGVLYYTTVDRVFFQQRPKVFDNNGQVVAPPSYAQANAVPYNSPSVSAQPSASLSGPPPPYETVVQHSTLPQQPTSSLYVNTMNNDHQPPTGQPSSQLPLTTVPERPLSY